MSRNLLSRVSLWRQDHDLKRHVPRSRRVDVFGRAMTSMPYAIPARIQIKQKVRQQKQFAFWMDLMNEEVHFLLVLKNNLPKQYSQIIQNTKLTAKRIQNSSVRF